jgi:hypothetical protein
MSTNGGIYMKYFAGIGSRKTPNHILEIMEQISEKFTSKEYTLRSGGALGADQAFERGSSLKEIFLAKDATQESIDLALEYHPNPGALRNMGKYAVGLAGRNMQIVLGLNLDKPVEFIICYTKDGELTGGTAHAIRLCLDRGIPVFNLGIPGELEKLRLLYLNL